MKKALDAMRCAVMTLLLLASCTTTFGQIFSDDFTSGASAQWGNERGDWLAAAGVYSAQSPSNSPATYTSLPFDLADFAVDVDINDVGDGGIWLRSDAAGDNGVLLVTGGNGWGAGITSAGRSLYWHVVTFGSYGPIVNEVTNVFSDPGVQDVHLRVTAIGDTYSVYVNGATTPATTLTTSLFPSGHVGLYDYSTQTFDNVAVFAIPEPVTALLLCGTMASLSMVAYRRRMRSL